MRVWLRRAGSAERAAAGAVGVVVIGLLAWALVPTGGTGGSSPGNVVATSGPGGAAGAGSRSTVGSGSVGGPLGSSSAAPAGGTAGAGSATAPAGGGAGSGATAPGAVGTSGGTGGGGATAQGAASSCHSPPGSDVGVTASQIHIGITEVDLEGPIGNSLFNIRSDQDQINAAVVDSINRAGGIACRKVVATIYKLNPLDSSAQHATCLQMVQDHLFAVLDGGAFYPAASRDCVPQNHLLLVSGQALLPSEARQYSPYVMDLYPQMDTMMKAWITAMKARGWFDSAHGFHKGALVEDACATEVNSAAEAAMAAAGLAVKDFVKTVYDCTPSGGTAPPAQIQQSVVQEKLAGVTNVVWVTSQTNLDLYTNTAEQQDFHPRYTMSDYDSIIGHEGPVNPLEFDGALGISNDATGGLNSGLPANAATQRCNQAMTTHHVAPMVKEPDDDAVGSACAVLYLFAAAVDRAPSLTRAAITAGLDQLGRVQEPFPYADGIYNRPGKVSGGDFWRPVQWQAACRCWKVLDPNFQPNPA